MLTFFRRIPIREIPELDTIRFLSILLVVLHHQFFTSNPILKWFSDYGWVGVDIFFVMSGFLITTLLLTELSRSDTINLRRFWFRRILRLWPSWFFTLMLSMTMVFLLARTQEGLQLELYSKWWHYFLHFGNYSNGLFGKIHNLFSHFWSLAVEEHFYLIWPLFLITVRSKKHLLISVSILVLLTYFIRLYHVDHGANEKFISFSTHTRIDELLMGCLLAFIVPRIKNLTFFSEMILTLMAFLLFAFALLACSKNIPSPILYSLTYSLIGFASCILIILAVRGGRHGIRSILSNKVTARLGVLSYGVYLSHLHVNYIVFSLFKRFHLNESENIVAFLNFVLPFIPAYFMYFYLDEYFARFKHRRINLPTAPMAEGSEVKSEATL